jgi:glycerate kinase
MTGKSNQVLVAMNGFKGSLSNLEACESVARGLSQLKISHAILPIGDGGNGTGLALHYSIGGEFTPIASIDPKGRKVTAEVLCFPDSTNPFRVYIDSSSVCGFTLIAQEKRKALEPSSSGLGKLLVEVSTRWKNSLKEIWIGLGDSAVSDMGIGMLSELGVVFLTSNKEILSPKTENLIHICDFSNPTLNLSKISLTVLCDVSNPICGPQGSARIFSPQKGATPEEVALIARGMDNFASRIENKTHRSLKYIPMTGSAGGLSSALLSFLGAKLVPGCEFLLQQISFDEKLAQHSIVVTGEGQTDSQTLKRKAPAVVALHAKNKNKKSIIISGSVVGDTSSIISELNLFGLSACGREPTAQEALFKKTLEVFSQIKSF